MKRFITYVYVYENGVKGKNAGFIKAELRDGMVKMEMQFRGLGRFQGNAKLNLIVPDQAKGCGIAIPFGTVEFHHGMANTLLEDKETQIASSRYDFSQVVGVRMELDDTHYLASCWVEHAEQYVCNLRARREDTNKPTMERPEASKAPTRTAPVPQRASEPTEKAAPVPQRARELTAGTTPAPQKTYTSASESDALIEKRKIDIADIHKLPKQNWYLCNNSFLIHGFFNYHYLMVKRVTEDSQTKYYLGVPGVYEKPERMMALLFGFPEFEVEEPEQIPADSGNSRKDGNCREENRMQQMETKTGRFGYWYCLLDM